MSRPRLPTAPDAARIVGMVAQQMRDFPIGEPGRPMPPFRVETALRWGREAASVGSVAALVDAVVLCRWAGLSFPDWVTEEAERLRGGWRPAIGYSSMGRTSNVLTWQRERLKESARFDTVHRLMTARKRRQNKPLRVAWFMEDHAPVAMTEAEYIRHRSEWSRGQAVTPAPGGDRWGVASQMLANTGARASPFRVKKSYETVRASLSRGEYAVYYFPMHADTLRLLGWDDLVGADIVPVPSSGEIAGDRDFTGVFSPLRRWKGCE